MLKDKEQVKNKRLLKTYGISLADWIKASKDGCAICGVTTGRICQDHIHVLGFKKMSSEEKKKYLRGALCFMCNTALKGFEKTKDGLRNRRQLEGTYKYFKTYKLKGEI
jgi:hypothetical protein